MITREEIEDMFSELEGHFDYDNRPYGLTIVAPGDRSARRQANLVEEAKYQRAYRSANRDKRAEYQRAYRARKASP